MSVLTELSNALADAVERAAPAVVRVDARRGYGATGLAWTEDGYVITASHVVQRTSEVNVAIPGVGEVGATLAGRDRSTDLAVLKVDHHLPSLVDPAPAEARVGNLVLALGAQSGEDQPMASFGVVATINRPWRSSRGRTIETLVRSDVTLYPGFSGGPLVDAGGQVLGLNTSALTRGLAATLPWALVVQVAESLVQSGSVNQGYLGLVSQPIELPAALRAGTNFQQENGLLIVGTEDDGPAANAGLLVGDIIVRANDVTVDGIESLQGLLGPGSAGSVVHVQVIRGGQPAEVNVTIGELE